MVVRVAWCVHSPDRSSLDAAEHLAVLDRSLAMLRGVFINTIREVRVHPDQVGYTPGVVSMPVRQEHLGQFDGPFAQGRVNQVRPCAISL